MPKSPEEMEAAMIANLPEKTGKSLDEWLKIIAMTNLAKHGQIVKHLKGEHGVTHGFANLIAHHALRAASLEPAPAEEDLVAAQYAGAKAGLRPIYEAILQRAQGFGKDVEIAPKKTYVSFRRAKQFALVQPSTKTRVDVGIQLKGTELADGAPSDRLEPSGSFNAMVSHRVRLTEVGDVDAELTGWLRTAYENA